MSVIKKSPMSAEDTIAEMERLMLVYQKLRQKFNFNPARKCQSLFTKKLVFKKKHIRIECHFFFLFFNLKLTKCFPFYSTSNDKLLVVTTFGGRKTVLCPIISLSKYSLIIVTSLFGSICFSISLLPSMVKIFLILRPSIVVCSLSWPGINFCWWVLNGRIVLSEYSLSFNFTIWV